MCTIMPPRRNCFYWIANFALWTQVRVKLLEKNNFLTFHYSEGCYCRVHFQGFRLEVLLTCICWDDTNYKCWSVSMHIFAYNEEKPIFSKVCWHRITSNLKCENTCGWRKTALWKCNLVTSVLFFLLWTLMHDDCMITNFSFLTHHCWLFWICVAESFVKLNLISRNNIVTVGENVELICRVRGLNVPITLTWSLQRDASTLDNILTLYSDGSISWSGDQHRYQLKVENKRKEVIHYLLINGASHREAGRYQCSVSVFLENVHKKLPPSNQLAVNVQNPGTAEICKACHLLSCIMQSISFVSHHIKPCLLLL